MQCELNASDGRCKNTQRQLGVDLGGLKKRPFAPPRMGGRARVGLVNRLENEARTGRRGRRADYLTRLDCVVLDELGYLPFAQTGGELLLSSSDCDQRERIAAIPVSAK